MPTPCRVASVKCCLAVRCLPVHPSEGWLIGKKATGVAARTVPMGVRMGLPFCAMCLLTSRLGADSASDSARRASSLLAVTDEISRLVQTLSRDEALQLRETMVEASRAIEQHHQIEPPGPGPIQPSECGVVPDPYPSKSNLPLGHREKISKLANVPLLYFEAGYFGNVSSGDPRVFGPDAWRTLHRFSIHYPEHPTALTSAGCRNFLSGLPFMLPCTPLHCQSARVRS